MNLNSNTFRPIRSSLHAAGAFLGRFSNEHHQNSNIVEGVEFQRSGSASALDCVNHSGLDPHQVFIRIVLKGKTMVFATKESQVLPAVAGNAAGIGSAMAAGNSAAAGPRAEAIPVAPHRVSALIAAMFAASVKRWSPHKQFVAVGG